MAVSFCAAALFFKGVYPASALSVEGMPAWLEAQAVRGLSAVWNEIPPGEARLDTLSLVARRLFSGYDVAVKQKEQKGQDPAVIFTALAQTQWRVIVTPPELRLPTDAWFERDTAGMEGEILSLLEELPVDALAWADSELKNQVGGIVERCLPGWDFSLLARLENNDKADNVNNVNKVNKNSAALQVTFHPRQPLILAVTPSIFSSTLPVMFQSDLTAKLIRGMSPVIGLPVEWVGLHRGDVELLAQEFLEDRNTVSNTRSNVNVAFIPGQVSEVDASVNSERFIFQMWFSAYAGIDERYPEAGLLAGWNAIDEAGLDIEIYDEVIVEMGSFGLVNRLGARLKISDNLQAGAEFEWPEHEIWYRAWWGPERVRRPYAWWRYSPKYGHNAAFGYRINEYLSVELHYDNRYDDRIGLRGILLL